VIGLTQNYQDFISDQCMSAAVVALLKPAMESIETHISIEGCDFRNDIIVHEQILVKKLQRTYVRS
jgi:hypothetical protein